MNGLPAIANNLAAKGRYGDSMLMHVSPGEVKGLQALAMAQGGSLTINPDTGLPEAFKLKDLLPTLIGAGLSFIPGVGPLMAAGIVGSAETIRTGDLGKGLMAGLGAYGGAGLGTGLSAAGSAANTAAASNIGNIGAQQAADAAMNVIATPASTLPAAAPATFMGNLSQAGAGAQNLFSMDPTGSAARSAFLGQAADKAAKTSATGLGGGVGAFKTAGALATQIPPPTMELPTPEDPYANYKGPYTPSERRVSYPGDLSSSREFMYFDPSNPVPFAEGGEVDRAVKMPVDVSMTGSVPEFNYGFRPVEVQGRPFDMTSAPTPIGGGFGGMIQRVMQQVKDQQSGAGDMTGYKYDPMTQSMVKMAGGGSVPQLEDGGFVLTKKAVDGLGGGDNKRGQMTASRGLGAIPIKGKGHGTSDSIKTSIDGMVPARVSNGEAYVPRRAVKKAGGADKLYALMRKAERRA